MGSSKTPERKEKPSERELRHSSNNKIVPKDLKNSTVNQTYYSQNINEKSQSLVIEQNNSKLLKIHKKSMKNLEDEPEQALKYSNIADKRQAVSKRSDLSHKTAH